MTLLEACRYGERELKRAGVPEAGLNAWLLLEYVSGCSRSHYLAYQEEELSEEAKRRFLEVIERRSKRVPLQYITGTQEFMGHSFLVSDQVLIPRQDTEVLVEEVLKVLKPGMRFLDLCTGSGCILLSLLLGCPGAVGVGSDISLPALKIAEKNRAVLGQEALLLESDLFEKIEGFFDLIVSNPPYIPSGEIAKLMPEVRDHEPHMALDGMEDGLYFYRRIIDKAPSYLRKSGRLFFEIGCEQAKAVSALLREKGFGAIEVIKDYAGLDRVVKADLC